MNPYNQNYNNFYPNNSNRFIAPFAGPFLLGALTGGAAVAVTNPYRPRPYYPANQGYYQPYPPRPYYF